MQFLRGAFFSALALLSVLLYSGCNKRAIPPAGIDTVILASHTGVIAGRLDVSLTRVQLGQPLIATLHPTAVFPIRWSAQRPSMSHVTPADRQAMFLFEQPGYYYIMADALGIDIASVTDSSYVTIYVTDTIYKPTGPAQDTLSLTGDQVSLTPTLDSNANLILLAQTKNTYGCLPNLVYSISTGSNGTGGISILFQEVVSNGPGNCTEVMNPASAYVFPPSPTSQWPDGSYPLSVSLNGVVYTGTLTITDKSYSVSWNYTSGVTFSSTQINKK